MVNKYELLKMLLRVTPPSVRRFGKRFIAVPGTEFDDYRLGKENPYRDANPVYCVDGSPVTLGIIREIQHYHHSYIGACRDLGISYKLLDIFGSDWISVIEQSGCDAFLVWPSVGTTVWKQMFDDRLRCMEEDLGKIVYPAGKETWLYENKRRAHDWFIAHNIPHPRTWVFYDRKQAMEFAEHTELPIVFKASHGGTASGVRILRTRSQVKRMVRKMFAGGMVPRGYHPQDRQRGSAYFQEYLPDVKEWRMVRIGDSYFGFRKEQVSDFHSGSRAWTWLDPPRPLLDLLRKVTALGGFTSMDVDIFQTADDRLLVNELQTVFGTSAHVDQLRVNDKPGRYVHDDAADQWIFEEGDFCQNACCNARIQYLIDKVLTNV